MTKLKYYIIFKRKIISCDILIQKVEWIYIDRNNVLVIYL